MWDREAWLIRKLVETLVVLPIALLIVFTGMNARIPTILVTLATRITQNSEFISNNLVSHSVSSSWLLAGFQD